MRLNVLGRGRSLLGLLAEGAFGDAEFGEDAEVVVKFLGGNAAVEQALVELDGVLGFAGILGEEFDAVIP